PGHSKSEYTGAIFTFLAAVSEGLAYSGRPYRLLDIAHLPHRGKPQVLLGSSAYSISDDSYYYHSIDCKTSTAAACPMDGRRLW
ncbi:hypothetical protein, partial [Paracidovorax sp. MALMAid1276]|uniref:hypothetical protein n=1 Tax=Paracidovorax sp. MALMAid1276 TaxID=3411631 RepID=UPI003B9CCCD3